MEIAGEHERHSPEVLGDAVRVDVHVGEDRGVLPRLGQSEEGVHPRAMLDCSHWSFSALFHKADGRRG